MNGTVEPHDRHDRHLVAALAADDLEPIVRTEAEMLVAACRDCAELLADLRLIAAATAALPLVPRTIDFRISPADAARLRPRGWRALLDAIGGARATFSRPLATGLTTLGLVGLLVTTIPPALGGLSAGSGAAAPAAAPQAGAPEVGRNSAASAAPASNASALDGGSEFGQPSAAYASAAASIPTTVRVDRPSPSTGGDSAQAVGTAAPVPGGGVGVPQGGTKGGGHTGPGSAEASASTTDQTDASGRLTSTAGPGGAPPLLLISIVCLTAGLGLFLARWGARRLTRR